MKETRLLVTTQIRIFPPDEIPLLKIMVADCAQKFQELFGFAAVAPTQQQDGTTGVLFSGGTYEPGSVLIESVSMEGRKMGVKVQGTTEVATAVFQAFAMQIEEINGHHPLNEIVCTHETATSVILDFPITRVFSKEFLGFIQKTPDRVRIPWADPLVLPANLKFAVRYKPTDEEIIKHGVFLASKELIIEPRAQSAPDELLYWIVSPTDTTTHFKLIKEFERSMKK
jgi:hypothetical protein